MVYAVLFLLPWVQAWTPLPSCHASPQQITSLITWEMEYSTYQIKCPLIHWWQDNDTNSLYTVNFLNEDLEKNIIYKTVYLNVETETKSSNMLYSQKWMTWTAKPRISFKFFNYIIQLDGPEYIVNSWTSEVQASGILIQPTTNFKGKLLILESYSKTNLWCTCVHQPCGRFPSCHWWHYLLSSLTEMPLE